MASNNKNWQQVMAENNPMDLIKAQYFLIYMNYSVAPLLMTSSDQSNL